MLKFQVTAKSPRFERASEKLKKRDKRASVNSSSSRDSDLGSTAPSSIDNNNENNNSEHQRHPTIYDSENSDAKYSESINCDSQYTTNSETRSLSSSELSSSQYVSCVSEPLILGSTDEFVLKECPEDTSYMIESAHDSSSGIASDDHNGGTSGNSESSPTSHLGKPRYKSHSNQNSDHVISRTNGVQEFTTFGKSRHNTENKVSYAYQETDLDDPNSGHKLVYHGRDSGYRASPTNPNGYRISPTNPNGQRISPSNPNGQRISPSNSNGQRISPSNSNGQRISPSTLAGLRISPTNPSGYRTSPLGYNPMNAYGADCDNPELFCDTSMLLNHVSYFDILPDDVITKIFQNLSSDQLMRCSQVCRRWYNLVWDATLWKIIKLNNALINIDKALKVLTKRLSYDTPTVCVMVERVNLSNCQRLTDKGLMYIAKRCPELRQLEITGCPNVSNIAVFEVVSRCVNLEHLNVSGCSNVSCVSLTPEATLQAQTYGKQIYLRHLDMSDCINLADSGLQIIAAYCSQLVFLYLRRCYDVTDIGVQYVSTYCTNLRELSISDCRKVTDFGMREISKLGSNLRYLSVAKCDKISDVGMRYIAKHCHKVRYLNVRGCEAISDDSIDMVARHCTRIKSLDIGKCEVTDEGLDAIAQHSVHLRKLSLKSCELITDKGVSVLASRCRALQQLNIQECHLSVEAYRAVRKYCKRCIIEHTNPGFC